VGPRGYRLLQPEYRDAFEQDLRRLHALSGPWDLVLISGNLTQTGSPREFDLLSSTLDSLWSYLKSLGSDPTLLVVPGPRDFGTLKLAVGTNPRLRSRASAVRKAFLSDGTGGLKQGVTDALTPFSEWFDARRHPRSRRLQSFLRGLLPGDFAATVSADKLKVGVIGLNSLFRNVPADMQGSAHEADLEQLEAATGQRARHWGREHDFLLLLTHHPAAELRPKPMEQLLDTVVPTTGFALHLCSASSGPLVRPLQVAKRTLHFPVRSLFGVGGDGEIASGPWGYSAGDVELEDSRQEGRIRLFPRRAFVSDDSVRLAPDDSRPLDEDEAFAIPLGALLEKPAGGDEPLVPIDQAFLFSASTDIRVAKSTPKQQQGVPAEVNLQWILRTGRDAVRALAWSPTGDALAAGLSSGRIVYWRPGEESPRWTLQAHGSGVLDLCFSPGAQELASVSRDQMGLWSTQKGELIRWDGLAEKQGGALTWAPSDTLTVGGVNGVIQFMDSPTQESGAHQLKTPLSRFSRLSWSPDGRTLAFCGGEDLSLLLWAGRAENDGTGDVRKLPLGQRRSILDLAWMPGSPVLAAACRDWTVRVWDTQQSRVVAVLQAHTDVVLGVSFSFDGRLLASKSLDGTVRLFRTDTWEEVARLEEPVSPMLLQRGVAFSPKSHVLATIGGGGRAVRLWDIDVEAMLSHRTKSTTVHAVSAKVVLVGEGRAGKSCLALRMAQDQYEELGSTHGMRFWTLPAEIPGPESGAAEGMQRELILWDMGGQEEYRLVHQLFLRDSTAALMVMEPGRGRAALEELEGWNQHLENQTRERTVRKLLVGTKVDDDHAPVDSQALQHFVKQHQLEDYVLTSARTGRGIPELKAALSRAIHWEGIEKISRPEFFQRLREHIQRLREARRVVLTFTELENELRQDAGAAFDPEALRAVVAQLARQGLVADTRMADGTRALILEVEQVERYASSLILAARDNPHGVPAIDMAKMQSPTAHLPRIKPEERLRRDQELIVLDCVIQLLLEHGLCLRHEGLLIFPSLFRPTQAETGTDFPHSVSLLYDFSGAIDNVYASLVTSLAVSQRFGSLRLWDNRAEFGRADESTSGVRRVQQPGQGARGQARLDVYFAANTPQATRDLFVSFIEEHLREQGVDLVEKLDITCVCGRVFPEDIVQARIDAKKTDVACSVCEHRTPLTLGAQQSQARNPELAGQLRALRTHIREQRSQSITETKVSMTEAQRVIRKQDTPIRILHLSDLHVGAGDDPMSLLQPLIADLRDKQEGLGVERLDYLVISGDITNRASPQEFERARELVSKLNEEFGVTSERCIIVPGNHDLDWEAPVYTFKLRRQVGANELKKDQYYEQGNMVLIRDNARYQERFRNFSQHFYHPLLQKEYPLSAEQQCMPMLFSETRLQFLAMNSAWEIDEHFQERSSINDGALVRGLQAAKQQVESAIKTGALTPESKLLRIAVWHHPITGNEKIRDEAFMAQLAKADVRACLHGHVHEDRADLINPLHPTRKIHIVGAGSFGAPMNHRPESTPRLFNLLEVERDLSLMRVRTRCMRKQGGAWEAWAVRPGATRDERSSFYELSLP